MGTPQVVLTSSNSRCWRLLCVGVVAAAFGCMVIAESRASLAALAIAAGFLIHKSTGLIFEYGWLWALTAAVIGLVGGAAGAFYPAIRAANLDPVNALAYE